MMSLALLFKLVPLLLATVPEAVPAVSARYVQHAPTEHEVAAAAFFLHTAAGDSSTSESNLPRAHSAANPVAGRGDQLQLQPAAAARWRDSTEGVHSFLVFDDRLEHNLTHIEAIAPRFAAWAQADRLFHGADPPPF